MYRLKSHECKNFKEFIDIVEDRDGHIALEILCVNVHGAYSTFDLVNEIITEDNLFRLVDAEIYYLDEAEQHRPQYMFVLMNGTIIVAQDMLHYGVY